MNPNRLGFSALELLVVVALIGGILALLLPLIQRMQDSARTAACASNLRQIGAAGTAYAADNRGLTYPAAQTIYTWNDAQGRDDYVESRPYDLLEPYLGINANRSAAGSNKVKEIFTCPQARATVKITQWASSYGFSSSTHPQVAAYRGGDTTLASRQTRWPKKLLISIPRISETISAMDVCLGNGAGTSIGIIYYSDASEMTDPAKQNLVADSTINSWDKNDDTTAAYVPRYRHNRNTVSPILFMDGHVETWRFKQALIRNWSVMP